MSLKTEMEMHEDFLTSNATTFGVYEMIPQLSGDATAGLGTAAGHPGTLVLGVTNDSTDQAYLYTSINMFPSFGTDHYVGEWCIKLDSLATALEDFKMGIGFSVDTNISPSVGAFFKYDRSVSNNWLLITANTANGVDTHTSSEPVVTGWLRLKAEFNPSTGYLTYSVNDSVIHTTNGNKIPLDPYTDLLGVTMGIEKTAGTEQRDFAVDYSSVNVVFGTTR